MCVFYETATFDYVWENNTYRANIPALANGVSPDDGNQYHFGITTTGQTGPNGITQETLTDGPLAIHEFVFQEIYVTLENLNPNPGAWRKMNGTLIYGDVTHMSTNHYAVFGNGTNPTIVNIYKSWFEDDEHYIIDDWLNDNDNTSVCRINACVKVGHFNSIQNDNTINVLTDSWTGNVSNGFTAKYAKNLHGENQTYGNHEKTIELPTDIGVKLNIRECTGATQYYVLGSDVTGNNYSTGDTVYNTQTIYMSQGYLYSISDENKKIFLGDIECDLDKLSNIPKKYYKWSDGGDTIQIGTSAQKLREYYPEVVDVNNNGVMAVSYERLSIIALAAIDKLYEEVKILKNKIKFLEEKVYED